MNPVPHDFTPLGLFLAADPIVKAVMIGLALASIACWAVIIEKSFALGRLRREVRALASASVTPTIIAEGSDDLTAIALRAGLPEWRLGQGVQETDGEYRARLDGAMRKAVLRAVRRTEPGLQILATTGSVAPFVGLFGTVWGIMNSFTGIAASNDTSLAVVAPGIAEALFATAIGLVAAIPAVMAYNRFVGGLTGARQEALGAASDLALRLSRAPRQQVAG
ncbi:MotA/TolQ/ExbB proton channel family protein [Roseococcus pinisoli]|uniref:MotA/TolQ/ExbB proton channel family protein n=1 Tax=Roseococcus pinisoli TaxID=2835040 RepID=A0ABS5QJQ4_9PROT|nr:MotA/TolQ/ExbB proton channel family protein [Roseococcus pinisoli]MBS7813172.1 MotA/TolQ/ExbB proton channel family protein [Roseococcus pinisoli]